MNWGAVTLEIGLLVLAVLVLGWDLIVASGRNASRRGDYVIGAIGLLCLLVWSFRLPVDVTFTEALVQDAFALYVKQVLLTAGLLTVVATYPYADRRGWSSRSA